MAYNILILGAAYGSLLASKMLFGGHKIHHVCLPAEADLINAEGFRVRLPVKGRKDPVLLDSTKLPGRVTASGAQGVNPKDYDLICLACRSRSTARPACANCSMRWRSRGAVHVDHEHAAAALREAHPRPRLRGAGARLHRCAGVGQLRSEVPDAVQPRSAGDPPAGREGQCADGHAADQLQGGEVRRREGHGDPAPAREGDRRDPLRSGDGTKIELPVKLRVYDFIFVPLAKWSMLLAGNYRCVTEDGMRTAQEAVHSDLATSKSVYDFVFDLCVKLAPILPISCRTRNTPRRRRRWCVRPRPRAPSERRAEHRARRQARAAHREAEGFAPSGDRRAGGAGRPPHRGEPQEGCGGVGGRRHGHKAFGGARCRDCRDARLSDGAVRNRRRACARR